MGGPCGHDRPRSQPIAHDSIVDLRVNRAFIEGDARAAGPATDARSPSPAALEGFAEMLNHIGLSRTRLVLQGYQKPACGWLFAWRVIITGPRIHVNHAAGRDHQLAGVTNLVGEYGRAKARRQFQPAVIAWAFVALGLCAGLIRRHRAAYTQCAECGYRRQQSPEQTGKSHGSPPEHREAVLTTGRTSLPLPEWISCFRCTHTCCVL